MNTIIGLCFQTSYTPSNPLVYGAGDHCSKTLRLSAHHKRERLRWARTHITFTQQPFTRVLFSGETRVHLNRADVWRRRGESYAEKCVYSTTLGAVVSSMSGVGCNNKTRLVVFDCNVNLQMYVNQVLNDVVVPMVTEFCSRMALDHTRQGLHKCS